MTFTLQDLLTLRASESRDMPRTASKPHPLSTDSLLRPESHHIAETIHMRCDVMPIRDPASAWNDIVLHSTDGRRPS